MCFALLSLALALSNQDDGDTTFKITTTGDSTITITCSHNQAPHHCATRVCDEFELSDTVEGVGCVEMLSDEISARRENSGDNGKLPSMISNDYEDARYIRLYRGHSDNDRSFTRFCSLHRVDMEACQLLFSQALAQYAAVEQEPSMAPRLDDEDSDFSDERNNSNDSSDDIASKPFVYVSVHVADHLTFSFGSEQFVFRTHHEQVEVAARICAQVGEAQQCNSGEVRELVGGAIETELDNASTAGLLELAKGFHLGQVNGWVISDPHEVNQNQIRVRASEDVKRVVATWCNYERCPDRVNTVALLADAIGSDDPSKAVDRSVYQLAYKPRLVVSLTSLPSRLSHMTQILKDMLRQDLLPDAIYINLPKFSKREQKPYVVPDFVHKYIADLPEDKRKLVHINLCENDFGPATKLIPTLLIETDPHTMIVTIDDDVQYPPFFLSSLYSASVRMPNFAVGFKGYIIPSTGDGDEKTYEYIESSGENDREVHVLGGFLGVAYRSGMFSIERIKDYSWYPEGAFFVDDDWISGALGWGGVRKYVIGGEEGKRVSEHMFNEHVVYPIAHVMSLNGKRQFRNRAFQKNLVRVLRGEGAWMDIRTSWSQVYEEEFEPLLGLRKKSFRMAFELLEKLRKDDESDNNNDDSNNSSSDGYVIVESGTTFGLTGWEESGQSTILFDRFLNFAQNDGVLHSVDLDAESCEISRAITSHKVKVHNSDSVEHFSDLSSQFEEQGRMIDLIYLDSWDVSTNEWLSDEEDSDILPATHALRELSAIIERLRPGGIVLIDDNMADWAKTADEIRAGLTEVGGEYGKKTKVRGKGRLVLEELRRRKCDLKFMGWQILFVCN
ncbi:hypothetical protein TrVE_jg7228 [Triparma verrucosa]|uniref:Uncharacterized protein n=1 Tax=Triparma verrucosa TaxID=1606542 RepID=A0A9W7F1G7_9STRA|nr:hypothetical protein TrVE_jg7228 [Triparma verrucosa]